MYESTLCKSVEIVWFVSVEADTYDFFLVHSVDGLAQFVAFELSIEFEGVNVA